MCTRPISKTELPTMWERQFIDAMQRGKATIAADGGLKRKVGTFGLVADWEDDKNQAKNRRPADASHEAHNSLRPEMHGTWAALKLLDKAMKMKPNVMRAGLKSKTHADNDEAMRRAKDKWRGHNTTGQSKGEHDVEAEIEQLAMQCEFVEFDCIKGHQDDTKKREEMTHPEWTNASVDKQATKARHEILKRRMVQPMKAPHLEASGVSMAFGGEIVHNKLKETTAHATTIEDCKEESMRRCGWADKCVFD